MSNETILKSAVAFFFLFFLNRISIENGQQGISYNGSRLYVCCGQEMPKVSV